MSNVLDVRGLTAQRGGRTVLNGVDLVVPAGSIVAMLGANGAGKTTLLKTISGIMDPEKGQIVFDGEEIQGKEPHQIVRRGIVQVPEGREVFPLLTVEENLALGAYTRNDKAQIARDRDMVFSYFPILAERRGQEAGTLSGGQQQMLALAMSFIMRPRVLLIDELSLGLAPVIVGQMLPVVQRLADEGVTVVLVEQSVNVALTVAHRAYFLERGEIRFSGPTAELLNRPDVLRSVFLSGAVVSETSDTKTNEEPRVVSERVVLRTEGVVAAFGGIRAVDGVSLVVHEQEIVGIIGPNGAGKSSLIKVLANLIYPDSGELFIDHAKFNFADLKEHCGYLIDYPAFYPFLSAKQNLQLFAKVNKLNLDTNALLSEVGLADTGYKKVRHFSTGMKQRLAIAQALIRDPEILILDEPFNALDQQSNQLLQSLLLAHVKQNGMVAISSHQALSIDDDPQVMRLIL